MVFETVKKMLAEQFMVGEDEITMDTDIVEDFGADSIDVVEMIMSIEEEYNVTIPDEAIKDLKTVGDFVEYVSKLM